MLQAVDGESYHGSYTSEADNGSEVPHKGEQLKRCCRPMPCANSERRADGWNGEAALQVGLGFDGVRRTLL